LEVLECQRNYLTELDVSKNLKLKKLSCYRNDITKLDLSKNVLLDTLDFSETKIASIDLSKNTALKSLNCGWNSELTSIDLSKNTQLKYLQCNYNTKFTNIDVSKNLFLEELYLDNVGLTSIDVSKNTSLKVLCLYTNKLTKLDVSKNPALAILTFGNNQLTELDVSNNPAMMDLECQNNKLTDIFLGNNPVLVYLQLQDNLFTSIDLSKNVNLKKIDVSNNQLTKLDVSKNVLLDEFNCSNNQLATLDLSKNPLLETAYPWSFNIGSQNPVITLLGEENYLGSGAYYRGPNSDFFPYPTFSESDFISYDGWKVISNNSSISSTLFSTETGITGKPLEGTMSFVYEQFTGITIDADNFPDPIFRQYVVDYLDFDKNGTLTLDEIGTIHIEIPSSVYDGITDLTGIEYFPFVKRLIVSNNALETLDVSKLLELQVLVCDGNNLTELDVSKNTKLENLVVMGNELTSIDVSDNKVLKYLNVVGNQLTELDVSKNSFLESLACAENKLTVISDLSLNTALTSFAGAGQLISLTLEGLGNYYSAPIDFFKPYFYGIGAMGAAEATFAKYVDGKLVFDMSKITTFQAGDSLWFRSETGLGDDNAKKLQGYIVISYKDLINDGSLILVNADNFPDDNFREWILNQPWGSDGIITPEEIENIKDINVGNKNIKDLTGLEFFTEITRLDVSSNGLDELDVSSLLKLEVLHCYNNKLTELGLSNNAKLDTLFCGGNKLTEIDVSKNTELRSFICDNNQLTALDVSNNTKLEDFVCATNKIKSLDMSKNTALNNRLICVENELTFLDVSNLSELKVLNCSWNKLTELDLSDLSSLEDLYCTGNQLTYLDFANNPNLTIFYAFVQSPRIFLFKDGDNYSADIMMNDPIFTDIASVGVITYDAVNKKIISNDKNFASTGFKALPAINGNVIEGTMYFSYVNPGDIIIGKDIFPDDNFRKWVLDQDYGKDGVLTPDEIEEIDSLDISSQGIEDMTGIGVFAYLRYLKCNNNKFAELDMSENLKLEVLICGDSQDLTSVDVTKNEELMSLIVNYTAITSLDLSGNGKLKYLEVCTNAFLPSLDISNNKSLFETHIRSNKTMTEVIVGENSTLKILDVTSNSLTDIDISGVDLTNFFSVAVGPARFMGWGQERTITLIGSGTSYSAEIDLNNPRDLEDGITYGNGTITSNSKDIASTAFKVEAQQKVNLDSLYGTLFFIYHTIGDDCEFGDLKVVKPATCTTDGYKAKVCSVCGGEKDKEVIPATGHNNTACGTTCGICGLNSIEHDLTELGEILSAPDCENGVYGIFKAACRRAGCTFQSDLKVINGDDVEPNVCERIGNLNYCQCCYRLIADCPDLGGEHGVCGLSIKPDYKNDSKYGVKFAKNIVSDNAVINVVAPEKALETKVVVYDAIGNIVFSTKVNGSEIITWDLRNNSGRFVANGGYLVIAEVKGINKTHSFSAKLGVNR